MNILEIAKQVGGGVFRELVPGAQSILNVINQVLPQDKQLPEWVTGSQVEQAVATLSPELQAQVLLKQFDVQMNQTTQEYATVRQMLISDAVTPQSTRPRIALGCFHVLAAVAAVIVGAWVYAVLIENASMTSVIMDGWPFVASIIAPFVTLLWAYFGILKQELRSKLDAANGGTTPAKTALFGLLPWGK